MNPMLSKALREFTTGPLNQLLVNLGGQDGLIWEAQLKRFLRKEPCWAGIAQFKDDMIVASVSVDRDRNPFALLDTISDKQNNDQNVVAFMPRGTGKKVTVYFFKVGQDLHENKLEEEYEKRGLLPADPYSLAAVIEADPVFADTYCVETHWKDRDGKWCCAGFGKWPNGTRIGVHRNPRFHSKNTWFAGLRE